MLLEQGWSPEQISDRLKKEQKVCISHEWIYQYILKDKQAGGELYRHLRCKKKYRCAPTSTQSVDVGAHMLAVPFENLDIVPPARNRTIK